MTTEQQPPPLESWKLVEELLTILKEIRDSLQAIASKMGTP